MRISFTVLGTPYAKKRRRFSRKIGRAFDPADIDFLPFRRADLPCPIAPQCDGIMRASS